MRISFVTTSYPNWVSFVYGSNPMLAEMAYQDQLQSLVRQFASAFFSFYVYLKDLGHETQLVLPDIETLQKTWCDEGGLKFTADWQYDVAIEQVRSFQPDIIYAGCHSNYMGDFYRRLKHITGRKLAIWFSSPIRPSHDFRHVDHVFSSSDQFVDSFRRMGIDSTLLKAGFDPAVLEHLTRKARALDLVSFVGSLSGHHAKREHLLSILHKRGIPVSLYGNGIRKSAFRRLVDLYNAGSNRMHFAKQLFFPAPYHANFRREVFGIAMYQTLMDSKIVINSHIDAANGMVGNMRMYESSGVGTCLVNDNGYNIREILEPDREVVVYNSPEEAADKIVWLLDHEAERLAIANAGQQRTLKDHSYKDRALEFIETLSTLV